MRFFIKVGTSAKGSKYHALICQRYGREKAITFDIEAILLVTNMSLEKIYNLPEGMHEIKF